MEQPTGFDPVVKHTREFTVAHGRQSCYNDRILSGEPRGGTFNEYLNFHRPCGFATETVDEKGKIKKKYETYLTPFEKLQSLPKPEQFLKNGVTMESLKEVEQQRSDIECTKLMQEKKIVLFRSFSKPGILT